MFSSLHRDLAVANFRRLIYDRIEFYPFAHQAEWQLASEGWKLLTEPPSAPGHRYVPIGIPDVTDTTYTKEGRHQGIVPANRRVVPRVFDGVRVAAHHLSDLAAYKAGKSYGMAAWASGFSCIPEARVNFIGLEYSTSEMEFTYLTEFLCSERGMNLKYNRLVMNIEQGKMVLELKNKMTYKCSSWIRKEGLKGKKITAYLYTEAYQLPGMRPYTSLKQNLRELRGFAMWGTTPDHPWVRVLHDNGHNLEMPDWHCTCGVEDDVNPVTFDRAARDADDPEKGALMTREQFAISHKGQLGGFIGRVYQYQRGGHLFSPLTHPLIYLPRQAQEYSNDMDLTDAAH